MGWDTHLVLVIRGGDGQENEGLNIAHSLPSTATGFINLQIQFILRMHIHTEQYFHLMEKVHSYVSKTDQNGE